MRLLVVGSAGMLGSAAVRFFEPRWSVIACARPGASPPAGRCVEFVTTDLATNDFSQLQRIGAPDVILNCAAITNKSVCDQNPELSRSVNALLPKRLLALFPSSLLIHVSSDAVLAPWVAMATEDSPVGPCSVYGRDKLEAEMLLAQVSGNTVTLRTTLVGITAVPGRKRHLVDWILATLRAEGRVPLFTDSFFTPISVWDFLIGVESLIGRSDVPRLLNLAGSERMTKYDFGMGLIKRLGYAPEVVIRQPLALKCDPGSIRLDQSLDSSLYKRLTGISLPEVQGCLESLIKHCGDHYVSH